MWRRTLFLRVTHSQRPYAQVLRAIELGGGGLFAAFEVFRQFENFYRRHQLQFRDSLNTSSSRTAGSEQVLGGVQAQKPLTQFCGRKDEVEPFTITLLKVLCDLQRLEEMRFLFMQCVMEVGDVTLSTELFNVYLLAISMSDTFNQHEVENVVELMKAKDVTPDVVTKLSMFILYLRLGQEECSSWWPVIADEVLDICQSKQAHLYPLLSLRLLHCFQTLVRLHHDVAIMSSCFDLLQLLAPKSLTKAVVVPYVLLSIANAAATPQMVVTALAAVDGPPLEEKEGHSPKPSAPSPSGADEELPALYSEMNILRLLAKCATCHDAAAAHYVLRYVSHHEARHDALLTVENKPVAALLYAHTLLCSGRATEGLAVLEDNVPAALCQPGRRPQAALTGKNKVVFLANKDLVVEWIQHLAAAGAAGLTDLLEELQVASAESGAQVSTISLDLFMAAFAHLGDCEAAERLLRYYYHIGQLPTTFTCISLVEAYGKLFPARGLARAEQLLMESTSRGFVLEQPYFSNVLRFALEKGDIRAARTWLTRHAEQKFRVADTEGAALVEKLTSLRDTDGLVQVLRALKETNSFIDVSQVRASANSLRRDGIPCDSLSVYL